MIEKSIAATAASAFFCAGGMFLGLSALQAIGATMMLISAIVLWETR